MCSFWNFEFYEKVYQHVYSAVMCDWEEKWNQLPVIATTELSEEKNRFFSFVQMEDEQNRPAMQKQDFLRHCQAFVILMVVHTDHFITSKLTSLSLSNLLLSSIKLVSGLLRQNLSEIYIASYIKKKKRKTFSTFVIENVEISSFYNITEVYVVKLIRYWYG